MEKNLFVNEVLETEEEEIVDIVEEEIDDILIIPGKQGVTNTQLIPALKEAVDENNLELVQKIYERYPEVYEKSFKYLQKTYRDYLTNNGFGVK